MTTQLSPQSDRAQSPSPWRVALGITVAAAIIILFVAGGLLAMTPAGQSVGTWLKWLFAVDSVQLWWYVTRASGIVAYLLLWFSTVLGLAVTSKFLDRLLDRVFTFDFHEFISLLSLAFVLLHVAVLLVDRYLPYSIWQILVPFISPYRPFWVGMGVIGFYITVLVTVTFYLRKWIGMRTFRLIHILSLVSYLGVTLHGVYAGTDTPLPAMKLLYDGTGLAVLFLTVYWLAMLVQKKMDTQHAAQAVARLPRRRHANVH